MMKFTFENLGAVDYATVEMASLTVICGENNTGKTYVSYTIYTLLEVWRHLFAWQVPVDVLRNLEKEGALSIDLQEILINHWDEIKKRTEQRWKSFLPTALAAPENHFAKTVLYFEFDLNDCWVKSDFEAERLSSQGKVVFTAKKSSGSRILEVAALRDSGDVPLPRSSIEDFLREVILEAVFSEYISDVFMASAERTGAVVFKDELNLTKNKIVNLLSQLDKSQHIAPNELFEAVYKQAYALPVNHNVRFVNMLSQFEENPGELFKKYPELFEQLKIIAGGNYQSSREGVTYFIPHSKNAKLSLSEASSAVRSLLILWYWLIGVASEGDILMIDEPELNLHPANQRRMARWIVRLVNCGVRVFVTTHSDYFVKELNTLIMFNQRTPEILEIAKTSGYEEAEFLDPDKIRLYVCKEDSIRKPNSKRKTKGITLVEADKSVHLGLEVSTFDQTIDDMNALQERLYYASAE